MRIKHFLCRHQPTFDVGPACRGCSPKCGVNQLVVRAQVQVVSVTIQKLCVTLRSVFVEIREPNKAKPGIFVAKHKIARHIEHELLLSCIFVHAIASVRYLSVWLGVHVKFLQELGA